MIGCALESLLIDNVGKIDMNLYFKHMRMN